MAIRYATLVFVTFLAAPVWADQMSPNPVKNARFGSLRHAEQANPYGKLFRAQQAVKPVTPEKTEPAKPRVVCGMLLVPADPSIDPKMRITPPTDANLEHTIRAITPPVCNPNP